MITAHPKSWRFLAVRFNVDGSLGLSFTGEVTISLFFLLFFGVVEADIPIVLLVQMSRTPGFDQPNVVRGGSGRLTSRADERRPPGCMVCPVEPALDRSAHRLHRFGEGSFGRLRAFSITFAFDSLVAGFAIIRVRSVWLRLLILLVAAAMVGFSRACLRGYW